jgi:putative ABC transport system permease protein
MAVYGNNTARIEDIDGVADSLLVYEGAVEFEFDDNNVPGYVSVFEDKDNFEDFMVFRDRNTKKKIVLPDDGVVIAEKTATRLGVKAGDTIVVKVSEIEQYEVEVKSVCENYIQQYIFMTEAYYKSIFGEFEYNEKFLILTDNSKEKQESITAEYLENEDVTGITYIDTMREKYMDMLGNLDIITVVLVISAGGLAFIVLYNLNNININERIRELATLKVLGFYNKEVSQYVYRENVISTVIGIIAGIILGKILHQYVIVTAEVDMVMFGRNVEPISYVYSAVITVLFAVIINGLMHFKLKKIDMTTSLKSVE